MVFCEKILVSANMQAVTSRTGDCKETQRRCGPGELVSIMMISAATFKLVAIGNKANLEIQDIKRSEIRG